jgi:hypothetical protein
VPEWLLLTTVTLFIMQGAANFWERTRHPCIASGVQWHSSEDQPALHRQDRKLLLFYFTDGSKSCLELEKTAFQNRQFVELVRQNFLPIEVRDTQREAGKNAFSVTSLEGKYHVSVFPMLEVALPGGELAYSVFGARSSFSTIQQLRKAIREASYTCGKVALKAGRDQEATESFRTYLDAAGWRDRQCQYAAIFGCIAYAENHQFDAARSLAIEATQRLTTHDWPYPALQFFAGQLTNEQFKESTEQEQGKLTEANYYLGAYLCALDKVKQGKELLEWVSTTGRRDYEEYDLAIAKLQRMKAAH